MSTFNDVVRKLKEIQSEIVAKGGKVLVARTNPSPDELINGIKSIETNRPQVTSANGYAIIVAERAGITIKLFDNSNTQLNEVTLGGGGYTTFTVASVGYYTAKAYDRDGNELWTNGVSVNEPGIFNIKVGLPMENYTWDELNDAAADGYIKYMFNKWDSKKLASFMGSTTASQITAYFIGSEHDDAVGGGKAGATFMLLTTKSKYKHWATANTNDNGVSWVGSLIRQNCLRIGEAQYIFDKSVTSTTSGTYYVFDDMNGVFVEQTLPDNYVAGTKYYTKTIMEADGAFIAGLPEGFINYLVQVKKKTWGGYGGSVTDATFAGLDSKVIVTHDWMFAPSVSEVFGMQDRYVEYDKYELEGEQYEAFKEFKENRFRYSADRWFRSPYVPTSNYFCLWGSNGYVYSNYANSTYNIPLCFCIGNKSA